MKFQTKDRLFQVYVSISLAVGVISLLFLFRYSGNQIPYYGAWVLTAITVTLSPILFVFLFKEKVIYIDELFKKKAKKIHVNLIECKIECLNQSPQKCKVVYYLEQNNKVLRLASHGIDMDKTILRMRLDLQKTTSVYVNKKGKCVFELSFLN